MSVARSGQGTETLTILYPDGEREFWFTDRIYTPGDVVVRDDRRWVVVRIDGGASRAENSTLVVMPEMPAVSPFRKAV